MIPLVDDLPRKFVSGFMIHFSNRVLLIRAKVVFVRKGSSVKLPRQLGRVYFIGTGQFAIIVRFRHTDWCFRCRKAVCRPAIPGFCPAGMDFRSPILGFLPAVGNFCCTEAFFRPTEEGFRPTVAGFRFRKPTTSKGCSAFCARMGFW